MKKTFFAVLYMICSLLLFADAALAKLARVTINAVINGTAIPGYVFFEGFDFEEYKPETGGIVPMLQKTHELLRNNYAANKQPFVFVGHSQGGLRALAMSTYLKNNDPALYRQLRGIVTLSGIDRGLKLLEGYGSVFRSRLYDDVHILVNGIYGTFKVFDFTPINIGGLILEDLINRSIAGGVYLVGSTVLSLWVPATKNFVDPILFNVNWDKYAQVRDMVPQSNFIKNYILTESYVTKNHKSDTYTYMVWKWRRGWLGIPYYWYEWVTERKKILTLDIQNLKIDANMPLTFLQGTNSNTLSMAGTEVERGVQIGMTAGHHTFRTAQVLHYAKCAFLFGFLTGSIKYSEDCRKASDWCRDYRNEISQLIGSSIHDGLVAAESQYIPSTTKINSNEEDAILNNVTVISYPQYNHMSINDGSKAKETAETAVTDLLK